MSGVSEDVTKHRSGQLPAARKADTREAGADVKESGLFADAGHLEGGELTSQIPSPLTLEAEVFL